MFSRLLSTFRFHIAPTIPSEAHPPESPLLPAPSFDATKDLLCLGLADALHLPVTFVAGGRGVERLAIGETMPSAESRIVFRDGGEPALSPGEMTGRVGFVEFAFTTRTFPLPVSKLPALLTGHFPQGMNYPTLEMPLAGVEPEFQGRGIFRSLLQVFNAVADRQGLVICLTNVLEERLLELATRPGHRLLDWHEGTVEIIRYPGARAR
jgi:hypothetical protein